ncbi:MAG: spermidine/putrescine ABC transporter substrate-binding protein [Actinomycetia bacterium]|nr:spermidine/putrescine ABC transporter substrate-binding protein [Actinomycetes bacterium]
MPSLPHPGSAALGMPGLGLSRRRLLGAAAGTAAVSASGVLAGCGNSESDARSNPDSAGQQVLNVANWPLYIDTKRVDGQKVHPTLLAFEDKYDIAVNYTEPINDMGEFFSKMRPILDAGTDTGYDTFVLTDWTAAKMMQLGWVEPLDKGNIPNLSNLVERLLAPPFDPKREYTVPWQSGITGIAYDDSQTGPVTSINDLLTNPDLAGAVTVLKDMRDTTGLVMLDQGADPEKFTDDQFASAIEMLQTATDSGHIRQYTGNNYTQMLALGDIKACVAWSGDIIQLQFDNPNMRFVVPDGGGMLWSDNMMVPNQAANKKNAELWMNYYCDPAVSAKLSAWVNYICPIAGAQEEMAKFDEELASNPLIFPSAADYASLSIFRDITGDEETNYNDQFQSLYI